jgi:hypothetical protein
MVAIAALVLLSAAACADRAKTKATAAEPAPFALNFDPRIFGKDSATIDNPYWTLKPGMQWTWTGRALDGEDEVARKIIFTVTDLTKEVAGVTTLVGWDRDFNDGVLAESELIFLAQDKAGNVWHFGQYAERYDEEGVFDGGTAWLVGYLEGAKAGILMPASPTPGTAAYSEGYAPPPYFWDDFARVRQIDAKNCVKVGCYTDVLVTEEFEPTKPDAFQLKYYAKGIGNIRTGWRGEGEEEQETLELVKRVELTAAELAAARIEALKHEARGNVYGLTASVRRREAA